MNPAGQVVLRQTRSPAAYAIGMATVDGHTWLAAGRVAIALAGDASVRRRVSLPGAAAAITPGKHVVWLVGNSGYVAALDERSGRRTATLDAPAGASDIAVWRESIWIASPSGLDRLDADDGRTLRHVAAPHGTIEVGEGYLWLLTYRGVLSRLDPQTGEPVGQTLELNQDVGGAPPTFTTGGGAVWVGLREPGVMRIDAATMRASWRRAIPTT